MCVFPSHWKKLNTLLYALEIKMYLKSILSHKRGHEFYRSEVLVSGYNELIKRIPSEVYERFVKKQYLSDEHMLNEFRLKTVESVTKEKLLKEKFIKLKDLQDRITETDCMQVMITNDKHNRELSQKLQLNKKMKAYKSVYSNHIPTFSQKNNQIIVLRQSKYNRYKQKHLEFFNFRPITENVINTNWQLPIIVDYIIIHRSVGTRQVQFSLVHMLSVIIHTKSY